LDSPFKCAIPSQRFHFQTMQTHPQPAFFDLFVEAYYQWLEQDLLQLKYSQGSIRAKKEILSISIALASMLQVKSQQHDLRSRLASAIFGLLPDSLPETYQSADLKMPRLQSIDSLCQNLAKQLLHNHALQHQPLCDFLTDSYRNFFTLCSPDWTQHQLACIADEFATGQLLRESLSARIRLARPNKRDASPKRIKS
jgi:hypothetical protein